MNTLAIAFNTKAGKTATIRFPKVKAGLTAEEATLLGNLVIEKNLFFTGQDELLEIKSCEFETSTYLVG